MNDIWEAQIIFALEKRKLYMCLVITNKKSKFIFLIHTFFMFWI